MAVRALWLCMLARMRTDMQVDAGTHLIGRRIRRAPSPWVSAESGEIFALVALPELEPQRPVPRALCWACILTRPLLHRFTCCAAAPP